MVNKGEKITSSEIKHALLSYFRFKRQCICASECNNNDVMAIYPDDTTMDIEIKINKYDLWKGEAKKSKHYFAKNLTEYSKSYYANKFYICVPTELLDEAEKWVNEINTKYGIIQCDWNGITSIKSAKLLHKDTSPSLRKDIMMRVCAENIGLMGKLLNKEEKNETKT